MGPFGNNHGLSSGRGSPGTDDPQFHVIGKPFSLQKVRERCVSLRVSRFVIGFSSMNCTSGDARAHIETSINRSGQECPLYRKLGGIVRGGPIRNLRSRCEAAALDYNDAHAYGLYRWYQTWPVRDFEFAWRGWHGRSVSGERFAAGTGSCVEGAAGIFYARLGAVAAVRARGARGGCTESSQHPCDSRYW